jgi:murein DD-endopeptidase MepM/ murein hydrolase activator NlpD
MTQLTKRFSWLFYLLLVTVLAASVVLSLPVLAQDDTPIPLVHTVQEGENLTFIAEQYGVTVADLLVLNGLSEEAILWVGQELIIPGGEGEAVFAVHTAVFGETLATIARQYNTSVNELLAVNQAINAHYRPAIGQRVTVVSRTGSTSPLPPPTGLPHLVQAGDTLLTIAAQHGLSPLAIAAANGLDYPTYLYPGQRLRIPIGEQVYRELPGSWVDVVVRSLPVLPGQSLSIYVENVAEGQPQGQLAGQTLRFSPHDAGYVALIGFDAFTEPDDYLLELSGDDPLNWPPLRQPVTLLPADFGTEFINVPADQAPLLEPSVRENEDAFLDTIYTQYEPEQLWDGLFQVPVTNTIVTSPYGNSRSYNGGPFDIFHTGVDFGGTIGTPILAPADGVVVYTGNLELRGRVVIVNHGLGVMTAYFHLSDIFVAEGDVVTPGQTIAAGGSTGLSTGPHLHWDLRIMGTAVNPLQWTEVAFP